MNYLWGKGAKGLYAPRPSDTNRIALSAMIRDRKEQSSYGFFEKPFWLEERGGSKT